MNKIILVILLSLLPYSAFADTHIADTCSQADVQTAITAASENDTVTIPSGTCTWASEITISTDNLIIQGTGKTNTTIKDPAFILAVDTDGIRITGINFEPVTKISTSESAITVGNILSQESASCDNLVIDNCEFDGYKWAVELANAPTGVIYSNSFIDGGVYLLGHDTAWTTGADLGSSDFIFIEDNTYTTDAGAAVHIMSGNGGGRYVFRYNNVTSSSSGNKIADAVDAHGYGHGNIRATRAWEIYSNTFTTAGTESRAIFLRGGSGVGYDNVFNEIASGYSVSEIYFMEYRLYSSVSLNYGPTGGGTGTACNTIVSGATYDECEDTELEPCCDQIGRGVDQALDPAYFWDNNKCTSAPCLDNLVSVSPSVHAEASTYIEEDEDYYLSEKGGYAPYTYPHTLRGEASASPATRVKLGSSKTRFNGITWKFE